MPGLESDSDSDASGLEMPGLEPDTPGLEPDMPGLEPTVPELEPTMPGLETVPGLQDIRIQLNVDSSVPRDTPTILVTNFRDDVDEVCMVGGNGWRLTLQWKLVSLIS